MAPKLVANSAEKQLIDALPEGIEVVSSDELRKAFEEHYEVSGYGTARRYAETLGEFEYLDCKSSG